MSKNVQIETVIAEEDKLLRERRRKIMGNDFAEALDDNRFGLALSGGGIRSATVNLGILKTLHKFGIIKQADYLSTVSGGGYTGAYIQATTKEKGQHGQLFDQEHLKYMRKHGDYLFPGTGLVKIWNQITLIVAFLVSFLMSLISPAILIGMIVGSYFFCDYYDLITIDFTDALQDHWRWLMPELMYGAIAIFVLHYLINIAQVYRLDGSNLFNKLETFVVVVILGTFVWPLIRSFQSVTAPNAEQLLLLFAGLFILLLMGMFTNPNATSFHRFYRKQLADAYLHFAMSHKNILLHKLCQPDSDERRDYLAPYPLINTCLNLQSSKDPHFQGAKASDYFLLSPLYCGAKLVNYVRTADTIGYRQMTLPAAVTISAAAVNPGLGVYSNKLLSVLLTIFNLRLGFWTWNPRKISESWPVVWWPFYFFYELLGRIGTDKKMVNISDGGHIENLGVMELLRRKCKLIVSIDASADPFFTFPDLENLTVRARNELGVDIRFRPDNIPEDIMRVKPSHGYSRKRYAVADLYQLWERVYNEEGEEKHIHYPGGKKTGVLVYVKSTVTAPTGRPENKDFKDHLQRGTYFYKIYNPSFPHESTADQFFDPIQWESYFQLGQFIAGDMLGVDNLNNFDVEEEAFTIPLDELYRRFDENIQLFGSVALPLPSTRGRSVDEAVIEAALQQKEEEEMEGIPTDYKM
jgi:hypothetical protein